MESDSRRVLAVLDGGDVSAEVLEAWATSADVVLAADGAADRLLACGVVPAVTIGDMDSVRDKGRLPRLVEDRDQSTSDADKLLGFAVASGFDNVTLIGVEGDRLDHVVASLASAARSPLHLRMVLRSGIGWVLTRGRTVEIETESDDVVSLIPIEECAGVQFEGVRWPLTNAALSPTGLVSLSNRASGTLVRVTVGRGSALLMRVGPHPAAPHW